MNALGRLVFRLRGILTPLAGLLAVLASWRDQVDPGPGGADVDAALNVIGCVLFVVGISLRFVIAGSSPTLNSQVRTMEAPTFVTEGPYSIVRHPLYFSNAVVALGILCIVNRVAAWCIFGGYFAISLLVIIRSEESLLRSRFAGLFENWRARVPALIPRRPFPIAKPFHWEAALRRTATPFFSGSWVVLFALSWEWWARGELTPVRRFPLKLAFALTAAVYITVRVWLRGRRSLVESSSSA